MNTGESANAQAWGLPRVLDFFDEHRASSAEIYPSEWIFLKDALREGMSVLDIGCAQGGFASVLSEHLQDFSYTGIDISAAMIERASGRHPGHRFLHLPENDFSVLAGERFDLVLVLGILHLHESWRDTIAAAWAMTAGKLVLDTREHAGPTVEDKAVSYFRMDFHGGDPTHSTTVLPYIVVNSAEALAVVRDRCPGARRIAHHGYLHPVSDAAVTVEPQVMTNAWLIER